MIFVEERFIELFATLPPTKTAGKDYCAIYEAGSPMDLNRFLLSKTDKVKQTGKGNVYPIIWLETPFPVEGSDTIKTFPLKLVLAVNSNNTLSNVERMQTTFKCVLNPLMENVLISLRQSGFTQIITQSGSNLKEYTSTNYFNYGTPDEKQHITTEIWDAIKLECTLRMTNNCLQTIKY